MPDRTAFESQDNRPTVQQSSSAVAEMIELLYSDAVCNGWHSTLSVVDVQKKREAARPESDLLWCFQSEAGLEFRRIDVRADRQAKTGNFLLEMVRDEEEQHRGWFLSSAADLLLYYFPKAGFVYAIPVHRARQWVLHHQEDLRLKRTKNKDGDRVWHTVSCLVPAQRLVAEVHGIRFFAKVRRRWLALSYDE